MASTERPLGRRVEGGVIGSSGARVIAMAEGSCGLRSLSSYFCSAVAIFKTKIDPSPERGGG